MKSIYGKHMYKVCSQWVILFQLQEAHLHRLSVRYPTINRYLRHRLSSCWSAATGSTACNTTTADTVTTNTAAAAWTGSSSGSSVRSTSAKSCGAGGAAGCGGVGGGGGGAACCGNSPSTSGRGPRFTLHGALCSSHLWPPTPLNGSPVSGRQKKKGSIREKKKAAHEILSLNRNTASKNRTKHKSLR